MFAWVYGIAEEDILATWTEDRFRRYQKFAQHVMKQGGGPRGVGR